MTELTRETLTTSFEKILQLRHRQGKFLRQDKRMVYDAASLTHQDIAKTHSMNNPQDAGYIYAFESSRGKKLSFSDNSMTLGIPEDPVERITTGKILETLSQGTDISVRVDY